MTLRDPDTNSLTYTLNWNDGTPVVNGTAVNGVPFTISHTYATVFVGWKSIVIIVSDGNSTESGMINIQAKPGNQPPVISDFTCPDQFLLRYELGYVTCSVSISDPEGGFISYTIDWEGDGTVDYNENSVRFLTGQVVQRSKACSTSICVPATYNMIIRATDTQGNSSVANKSIVLKNVWEVPSTRFAIGDRVRLQASGAIYANGSTPGAFVGYLGPQNGTVVGGPYWVNTNPSGYWAWKVNYDAGTDGWSNESQLTKI